MSLSTKFGVLAGRVRNRQGRWARALRVYTFTETDAILARKHRSGHDPPPPPWITRAYIKRATTGTLRNSNTAAQDSKKVTTAACIRITSAPNSL